MAIRHAHEWGDRFGEADYTGARELAGLPAAERRRFYRQAVAPYVFWTDALADHTGLPRSQTVYMYHPVTFLAALVARRQGFSLHWPARSALPDRDLDPTKVDPAAFLADWRPLGRARSVPPPIFGAAVDTATATRKRQDIPLIVLPRTE